MRNILAVVLSILFCLPVAGQSPDLVEARAQMGAAGAARDKTSYARFLSDDITSVDSTGRLRDKSAAIDEMPSGNSQSTAEIVEYGGGAVVAIGYERTGEAPARIIQAWFREGRQWQMVAFQGVRAIGAATPAFQKSSSLPSSSGRDSDRAAVQQTLDSVQRAVRDSDQQAWAALVTDRFLATSSAGAFQRKADVMRGFSLSERRDEPITVNDTSIRIRGTFAVANMRLRDRADLEFWRTAIVVKEGGGWRLAAEITTPITGSARSMQP